MIPPESAIVVSPEELIYLMKRVRLARDALALLEQRLQPQAPSRSMKRLTERELGYLWTGISPAIAIERDGQEVRWQLWLSEPDIENLRGLIHALPETLLREWGKPSLPLWRDAAEVERDLLHKLGDV